jgi:hypothetical protein
LIVSAAAGLVIGALSWIDQLVLPLVLVGPIVSGVVGGQGACLSLDRNGMGMGGVVMLISDWIVNNEDQAFHAVLTAVMVAIAGIGWGIGRAVQSRRAVAV